MNQAIHRYTKIYDILKDDVYFLSIFIAALEGVTDHRYKDLPPTHSDLLLVGQLLVICHQQLHGVEEWGDTFYHPVYFKHIITLVEFLYDYGMTDLIITSKIHLAMLNEPPSGCGNGRRLVEILKLLCEDNQEIRDAVITQWGKALYSRGDHHWSYQPLIFILMDPKYPRAPEEWVHWMYNETMRRLLDKFDRPEVMRFAAKICWVAGPNPCHPVVRYHGILWNLMRDNKGWKSLDPSQWFMLFPQLTYEDYEIDMFAKGEDPRRVYSMIHKSLTRVFQGLLMFLWGDHFPTDILRVVRQMFPSQWNH